MPDHDSTLIQNGTLIDGTGQDARPNPGILVQGNRIAAVGAAVDKLLANPGTKARTRILDAAGKFIMPGLIDGHVHISSHQGAVPGVRYTSTPDFAALWTARVIGRVLQAGVTSISVPGGKWFVDATIRDAINGGMIEGPRIFCAGRALTPIGGIFDSTNPFTGKTADDSVGILCNSVDDYRRETRRQCKRGVDMIKVADSYWGDTQTVRLEELQAVVDEAHRHNRKVSIHSRGSGSTRISAEAGVDWIYHADLATEDDLDAVAKAGIPIMPAFAQTQIIAEGEVTQGFSADMRKRVRDQLEINFESIRKARARGIRILAGTDSGNAAAFEHGRYHGREAEILVKEIGMTPMEAILAYTRDNAQVVGLEGQVGTIEQGKLADIIAWDANPLADITVLQQPQRLAFVMKDGREITNPCIGFRPMAVEPQRNPVNPQG
jgi:imidazolonepropionase-like amidohydrolase